MHIYISIHSVECYKLDGILISVNCFSEYRNDPKFSDRSVWANSAEPDQTAPSLSRVYTVCNSVSIFWTHYSMVEPHCSNFRVITTIFWVFEYLGNLRVYIISLTILRVFHNHRTADLSLVFLKLFYFE